MTIPVDSATVAAAALKLLGPHCSQVMATTASLVLVRRRIADGSSLEDALLAEAHHFAAQDRRVADEFLALLLSDLTPIAHGRLSEPLRRFLETGDLVQSVMGDLWPSLASMEFQTRAQFRGLLAQRLGWKATNKGRALQSASRAENQWASLAQGDSTIEGEAPGRPEDALVKAEELAMLHLMLLRLDPKDQDLLRDYLGGKTPDVIADERAMQRDAVYKALQRAIQRAREISERVRGTE